MIFVSIHVHRWEWTAVHVHGDRVARCMVCGDMAYNIPLHIIAGTPERDAYLASETDDSEEGADHA